jgi:hypothetical protein
MEGDRSRGRGERLADRVRKDVLDTELRRDRRIRVTTAAATTTTAGAAAATTSAAAAAATTTAGAAAATTTPAADGDSDARPDAARRFSTSADGHADHDAAADLFTTAPAADGDPDGQRDSAAQRPCAEPVTAAPAAAGATSARSSGIPASSSRGSGYDDRAEAAEPGAAHRRAHSDDRARRRRATAPGRPRSASCVRRLLWRAPRAGVAAPRAPRQGCRARQVLTPASGPGRRVSQLPARLANVPQIRGRRHVRRRRAGARC